MGVMIMKKWVTIIKKCVTKYIEDILIFSGLLVIIIATFLVARIIGLYITGLILFGLGVYFSRNPLKERNK